MSERKISHSAAKKVLTLMFETGKAPEDIIEELDLWLLSIPEACTLIDNVIRNNDKLVDGYKQGNSKLLNVLVGLVMKEAKDKVDASFVSEYIQACLIKD